MHDTSTLLAALSDGREKILSLVNTLSAAQLQVPYHPGINPPIWELGHCAYFFERFILQDLDRSAPYNPDLDEIWDSFELAHEDRWTPGLFPEKAETVVYFNSVLDCVEKRISSVPLTDSDLYLYKYAIFHLNMHIESLIWCRQILGYPLPPWAEPVPDSGQHNSGVTFELDDAQVPAGRYRIGVAALSAQFADSEFAFDNEKPAWSMELPEFKISRTLVSNREFLEFVESGGYENPVYWRMAGRKWLTQHGQKYPLYWKKESGQWLERHFDQWVPLAPDYPVKHISYWEAQAYCEFAGRRLPTEFEWEVAALNNLEDGPIRLLPWGEAKPNGATDMDGVRLARQPVDSLREGDSPFGCRQMIGTVWEWTSSLFMPYDGFTKDMYPFMSTLQFGDHYVTRGGSCATASALIRGTYRQAYQPFRNDVFVGFRTCALQEKYE